MKKIVFVLAIIVIGAAVLMTFNQQSNKLAAKQVAPEQKQKITIMLDWVPNTNHTGLYVAKDKGLYDKHGLDVQILQATEGDAGQIIASGKVDFGISSQESVTLARAQGIPLVSVAAIMQHNTSAFASLKDASISSVKDFESKRYGGWGSPIEKAVIESVMTDAGADYEKVKQVTMGQADFFTSIGRDSDFQWIFYGWDGIEAKRRGMELHLITLKDLDPALDYYTPVIVTNEKHVGTQKELVKKFITATAEGYTFAAQNPDESAAILLKNAPELNKDLVQQSQAWVSQQYTADAEKWGVQKTEVWNRYTDWLFEHKQIEKQIDSEKAFTNEFL